MQAHPRIKSSFTIETLEPRILFLMSEHAELVFEGEAFPLVARLMDGRRSVGEVLALASDTVPWGTAYTALSQLHQRGCLAEGEALASPGEAAFFDGLAVPLASRDVLRSLPVDILVLAGLPEAPFKLTLEKAGFARGVGGTRFVVTTDYLLKDLAAINREALETKRPWALVKPAGTVLMIGPLFRPDATGCWDCLAHRLRHNRQLERYVSRMTNRELPLPVPRGWTSSTLGLAASLAATELVRALTGAAGETIENHLLTFDFVKRKLEWHTFVRRPQCPACGDPRKALRGTEAITLESRPVAAGGGLEQRRQAESDFARVKHHVSPYTGIVTSLIGRKHSGPGVAHSFVAGHYFPTRPGDLTALRVNLVARSGGKGKNELVARTGAICEAIERYSGISWGDEPRREATWEEIAPEAVAVGELVQFSSRQYRTRDAFNATNDSDYHEVPPQLPEGARISWSPAFSLTRRCVRYLPTACCFYGFIDPGMFFTRADSNGCAAGRTLEDAILHGLLELVERDAVALWWYNRLKRPAVDGASFGLARWHELETYYRTVLAREIHVLDLTTDSGIPAFAVISKCETRAVEDVIVGFAAHTDPVVALSKALEEANQYLPAVEDRNVDGSTAYKLASPETIRWWRSATYENQSYLVPDPAQPPRRLSDLPSLATGDVAKDVEVCVEILRQQGLEVLVVDQTRPDIGLPVVRVVVPGLRHFWRRLAPGRLYDVPVKLGWLKEPTREEDMNPISCFV